jgi:cytochrome c-type biogenesis protein CcmE
MSDENDPIDEAAETLPWDPDQAPARVGGAPDGAALPATRGSGSGKIWIAALLLLAAGGLTFLVIGGVEKNLVYYLTPSELLAKGDTGVGANVRLGGMVQKDSINWQPESTTLSFTVTDKEATISVRASAIPPEMFREGIGVIVEGSLQEDGVFTTNRLMVRHSNEYKAPGDNETVGNDYMSETVEDDPS